MRTLLAAAIVLVAPILLVLGAPAARAQTPPCPAGMAWLDDFCIDKWEAYIEGHSPYEVPTSGAGAAATAAGVVPQGYISGVVAEEACTAAGKHLCTTAEWTRACRGRLFDHLYPYGDDHVAGACNDSRAVHPVIEVFGAGATFSDAQMNDPALNQLPDSLDATGANAQCVTPEGVYDLHGNLNEWIADPTGTWRGGFYVEASNNGAGCTYTTTSHVSSYHDFSTGFRCCQGAEQIRPYVPVAGGLGWAILATLLCAIGLGAWSRRAAPARG